MGFRNTKEYVEACESGNNWITQFRKIVPSINAGRYDISAGTGSYPANYFASSPLVAAHMPYNGGIRIQPTGKRNYIKEITMMIATSATNTACDGASVIFYDYLMYYPFIDLTSIDLQEFENPVTLPRYADGEGVRLIGIMQAPNGNYNTSTMTINYTNSKGVPKTVDIALHYALYNTFSTLNGIIQASGASNMGGYGYVPLANGDTGIRSIQSIKLSQDWGGLLCLVLAKPLVNMGNINGCRRTTTGALDSFGAPVQKTNLIHSVDNVWVEDGAYITPVIRFPANGAAFSTVVGTIETVWDKE